MNKKGKQYALAIAAVVGIVAVIGVIMMFGKPSATGKAVSGLLTSEGAVCLPDTDSPQVMQQSVSMEITEMIWEKYSSGVRAADVEGELLALYDRVYASVQDTHESP